MLIIHGIHDKKYEFPGKPLKVGGKFKNHWENGNTIRERNRADAWIVHPSKSNEVSQDPQWLIEHPEHKYNPLYILWKVPFIKVPRNIGEGSWKNCSALTKFPSSDHALRAMRTTYYENIAILKQNNVPFDPDNGYFMANRLRFPHRLHYSYYRDKAVYDLIDQNTPVSYYPIRPLLLESTLKSRTDQDISWFWDPSLRASIKDIKHTSDAGWFVAALEFLWTIYSS